MKTKLIILALCLAILPACGGKQKRAERQQLKAEQAAQVEKQQQTVQFDETCRNTLQQVEELQQKLNNPQQFMTPQGIREMQQLGHELTFEYDANSLDSAQLAMAKQLDSLVTVLHEGIDYEVNRRACNTQQPLFNRPDELIEESKAFPFYLERGDKLFVNVEMEKPADIRIYNANSHMLLKSYAGKKTVKDSIPIAFKAVYLLEINPKGRQYANIDLTYKPGSVDRIFNPKTVEEKEVEGQKGDFRVKSVDGLKMKTIFEEPRKFTLRSQLKATFSGVSNSDRAIVAIPVPVGASDVLYSLRISTNEGDRSSDGEFSQNMFRSYKKIKMGGHEVFERQSGHGSSLIEILLGENKPPREEEAYINMYVFYNAVQAKKFQDGTDPAKLQYSVDYSTMGTQSCNGRIPAKGNKIIYLGFQNERVRYNNYVWLEVMSSVTNKEYFKTEYSVK